MSKSGRIVVIGMPLAALRMNISFSGCGFLGIYHLGVAYALVNNGKRLMPNVQRFTGASSGACIAALLAIQGLGARQNLEACKEFALDLASRIGLLWLGIMSPGVDLMGPLGELLDNIMPPNAHELATNRLFVSVTNFETKQNEIVSTFKSREELISFLLASSCMPSVLGSNSFVDINGTKYNDGGFSNNLPQFEDGRTILVSPFDGRQDICPFDMNSKEWFMCLVQQDFRINLRNLVRGKHALLPPSKTTMNAYYEAGVLDAKRFLTSEGYYDIDTFVEKAMPKAKTKISV